MLYKLNADKNDITEISEITPHQAGLKEKHLENLIAKRIESVVRDDQLLIIMQERSWQEEPDILALDETGKLYIFELKRWESQSENILQVLRYGQKFGRYEYDLLDNYYKKYCKDSEKLDLQIAHQKYFDLPNPLEKSKFNHDQKMILITNGLDYETWDSIAYWKTKGLDIESLIFRITRISNELFIDFDPYGPIPDAPKNLESGIYIVNTNSTYNKDAYRQMITDCKASAYYDRKYSVDKIKPNDIVCLYHVGVGIIAIGKAKTDRQEKEHEGCANEEHFIPLEFEVFVDINREGWQSRAVKAWEINEKLNASHKFRQTVFRLPGEVKDFITTRLKEKNVV